jgi:hypothetical protein
MISEELSRSQSSFEVWYLNTDRSVAGAVWVLVLIEDLSVNGSPSQHCQTESFLPTQCQRTFKRIHQERSAIFKKST